MRLRGEGISPEQPNPRDLGSRLQNILESFNLSAPGVRGSAIADRNGLPIAAAFRSRLDLATVSAMSMLAVRAAQDVFRNFGYREARFVIMEGEDAVIVVIAIHGGLSALAVSDSEANLGLVRLGLQKLGQEILGLLQ